MAEKQEGQRIQRFPELDTIIDMVNWWIMRIKLYNGSRLKEELRRERRSNMDDKIFNHSNLKEMKNFVIRMVHQSMCNSY